MKPEDLIELLIAGRLRVRLEWDKTRVTCPHCEWSGEGDTPTKAEKLLKDHLHTCTQDPLKKRFRAMLEDNILE